MDFLLFALLNAAAACNAALITRRFRLDAGGAADGVTHGLLAGAVIFCFQVVFTSILLGHFGRLFIYNLLAAQMIILFAVSAYVSLPNTCGDMFYTGGKRARNAAGEGGRLDGWTMAPAAVPAAACFAALSALFIYCAVSPPPPTDAFLYHLVFPAEWFRSGRISIVQTLSTDQASSYYPANAELLYLWLMLPFHGDVAARFLQWIFAVVTVACGWGIARRVGLNKTAAASAAAATLLTPGFFRQVVNCDADIVFAAFFLMGVYFLLSAGEGGRVDGFVLGGLAAGLMAGAKPIGVLYCALLLPLVFSAAARAKREGGDTFSGPAVLWVVCVFAAGGYWYLRNLHVTGSPFYPLGVSVGGITLFPGAYGREAMLGTYLHFDTRAINKLFEIFREQIFGIPLLISGAAVAAAGIFARIRNKGEINDWEVRNRFMFLYLVCLPVLATLLFWFVNPYNTHNNYRFLLPALFFFYLLILNAFTKRGINNHLWPLALLCFATVGVFLDAGCGRILRGALGAVIGSTDSFPGDFRPAAALAAFFLICILAAIVWRRKNFVKTSAIVISVVALYFLFSARTEYLQASRCDWYAAHYLGAGWKTLEENAPGPARIAYAGNPAPYGLYGSDLKNDVLYVNTDGSERKFHDYEMKRRGENGGAPFIKEAVGLDYVYRSNRNFDRWREALVRKNVDYLFVSKQFFRGRIEMPVEGAWALERPGMFRQVFHQDDVWIFRIAPEKTKDRVSGDG